MYIHIGVLFSKQSSQHWCMHIHVKHALHCCMHWCMHINVKQALMHAHASTDAWIIFQKYMHQCMLCTDACTDACTYMLSNHWSMHSLFQKHKSGSLSCARSAATAIANRSQSQKFCCCYCTFNTQKAMELETGLRNGVNVNICIRIVIHINWWMLHHCSQYQIY